MAESPTMEVRARISADSAQFVKGVDDAAKSASQLSGVAAGLNKSLFAVGLASSTAAIALIAFGVRSFRAAAEVQELDIALQAIGASSRVGYTELSVAVKAITDVGIRATAAQRAVIRLAQSNVDLSQTSQLATVAQDLSVTASVDAASALQDLAFAITTTRTRQLVQLGITVQATQAFENYARTIGKASKDLTMSEKRQAIFNMILKEGSKATGAYALAIQSPSRALKEMGDITKNLEIAVGQRLLNAFSKVILSSFTLFQKFTQAAQGTGLFAKSLDAIEKVFTKLSAPVEKIATKIGNFIDRLDKSKVSVNEIAMVFEKALPAVAAFTTFVGVKAGKEIFQALPIFQGLFKMMNAGTMAFLVFAATSTQVRDAVGRLVGSLQPLLGSFENLGKNFSEISAVITGVFAKAIDGLTAGLRTSIKFFRENKIALVGLQVALGAALAALVAYKIMTLASSASSKMQIVVTKIKNTLFAAEAVLASRAAVAEANLARSTTAEALASAKATASTAALNVQKAANHLVTVKQMSSTTILGAKTKVLAAAEAQLAGAKRALSVATGQVTAAQGAQTAATNTLATAQARLAATSKAMLAPLLFKIAIIAAVVIAFVQAYKASETFRDVVREVFNTVAQIAGTALAFILTGLGNFSLALGATIAPTTSFGQTVIKVFQFVYTTTLQVFIGVVKALMMFLSALEYVTSGQTAFGKVVRAVLNFVFKAFATVVGGILKFIGFFLEGLGMLLDTHGTVGKVIAGILDFVFKAFAIVVGGIIKFIGMFIEFLGNLLDTNALVGKAITEVLDFLIDAFATVFGGIFKYIGMFIAFLGDLLDANSFIGGAIAKVIDFIASVYFNLVSKVSGFLAKIIGSLINFVEGNRESLEIIIDLFNKMAEGVGKALALIPNALASILEKIGAFVKGASEKVSEFFKDAANAARSNLLTKAAAGPLDALAEKFAAMGTKVSDTFTKLADPIRKFSTSIINATKQVISDDALDKLILKAKTIQNTLVGVSKAASGLSEKKFGTELVTFITDGMKSIGAASKKIGATILEVTKVPIAEALIQSVSDALTKVGGFAKMAGQTILDAKDIKLGTELVQLLSDVSKIIGGATSKVGGFVTSLKELEVGDMLGDLIGNVVDFALPQLEKLVNVMEGLKDVEVGKFLVENLSSLSLKAGETILGFAEAVKSFTSGDVLSKVSDGFGSIADALKKGLGFGDVLEEERKRAEVLAKTQDADDTAADKLAKSADMMKKIREAMADGLQSMRDVLADLQEAAQQFADSLKETIMSFAGLKGVELPDGFIPKAKSLIENMRMRLEKSRLFANQILTLQGLGLDAGAIKDLVESGPIKGAQIAASILGGGVEAISEINDLQKAIAFTGSAIGKFGSEAAFGGKIESAQFGLAAVTDAETKIRGLSGNNIVIEQGAFVVNVDTTGATDDDEKVNMITRRIQETFAILAKELANK